MFKKFAVFVVLGFWAVLNTGCFGGNLAENSAQILNSNTKFLAQNPSEIRNLNTENLAGNSINSIENLQKNFSELPSVLLSQNTHNDGVGQNFAKIYTNLAKNNNMDFTELPKNAKLPAEIQTSQENLSQIQADLSEIPTNSPQNDNLNAKNTASAENLEVNLDKKQKNTTADFGAEQKKDFNAKLEKDFEADIEKTSAENLDTDPKNDNAEPENDTANTADPEPNAEPENDTANADFADDFADDFEAEFDEFKVSDPLSGYNKAMTAFNVGFYTYFLRPVAKGYDFVMPDFAQTGIKNFFTYISMPIRLISNALQFKFSEAGTELKRFGINTVFGFFGLIDAASKVGVPIHHSDFGLVLAHWGVGSGFHFVLPILGPSNLRDTLAIPVNWYMSPTTYIDTQSHTFISWLSVGLTSFNILNEVSINTPTMDEIYYNTPSLYPFLRDAYEKRRADMSK